MCFKRVDEQVGKSSSHTHTPGLNWVDWAGVGGVGWEIGPAPSASRRSSDPELSVGLASSQPDRGHCCIRYSSDRQETATLRASLHASQETHSFSLPLTFTHRQTDTIHRIGACALASFASRPSHSSQPSQTSPETSSSTHRNRTNERTNDRLETASPSLRAGPLPFP